jgi:hypothetical protein
VRSWRARRIISGIICGGRARSDIATAGARAGSVGRRDMTGQPGGGGGGGGGDDDALVVVGGAGCWMGMESCLGSGERWWWVGHTGE